MAYNYLFFPHGLNKTFFVNLLAFLFSSSLLAQGSWNNSYDFPGQAHRSSTSFKIDGEVYYLQGGCTSDFWRFKPSDGSWEQLAPFPGDLEKADPVGFAIDSTGYIGTGRLCGGSPQSGFWAYDPSTDSWTQKSALPVAREMAFGFSINGTGYIGAGRTSSSSFKSEFYAYNPQTDNWKQMADFPANGKANCIALVYGDTAYVATGGSNATSGSKELHRYVPSTDTWSSLMDLPGQGRRNASGFAIFEYIYFGGGWDGSSYFSDFYRFNAKTEAWKQIPNKPGTALRNMEGFAVKGKGYLVGGSGPSGSNTDNIWVYRSEFVSQQGFDKEERGFDVYPNPAQGARVTIEESSERSSEKRLRILSMKGKVLRSQNFKGNKRSIDVSDMASGLYFIELEGSNGRKKIEKLIVQ